MINRIRNVSFNAQPTAYSSQQKQKALGFCAKLPTDARNKLIDSLWDQVSQLKKTKVSIDDNKEGILGFIKTIYTNMRIEAKINALYKKANNLCIEGWIENGSLHQ